MDVVEKTVSFIIVVAIMVLLLTIMVYDKTNKDYKNITNRFIVTGSKSNDKDCIFIIENSNKNFFNLTANCTDFKLNDNVILSVKGE